MQVLSSDQALSKHSNKPNPSKQQALNFSLIKLYSSPQTSSFCIFLRICLPL